MGIILATLFPGSSLFEAERGSWEQGSNLCEGWILLKFVCEMGSQAHGTYALHEYFSKIIKSRDCFLIFVPTSIFTPQVCHKTFNIDNTGLVRAKGTNLYLEAHWRAVI